MRSPTASRLRLHGWRDPTIVAIALLGVATGFAQYAPTASLADVATAFGAAGADAVGLSATTVGVGLAIIRFASLAALPLSSVADQLGRRRVLLACVGVGLLLNAGAALSPSFWWFVAVVAVSRPLFSATTAVGSVVASEQTRSADRAKAVALAAAGYGIGVGLVSVARVPLNDLLGLGFRGVFAAALLLLVLLPLLAPYLPEPDRFARLHAERSEHVTARPRRRAWTAVHPSLRRRLLLLNVLTFTFNLVTGPHNTWIFFYAEGELGVSRAEMAGAIVAAGVLGLVGLLLGRWITDRVGRRPTAIVCHALIAVSVVIAYFGSVPMMFGGFWLGVFIQGAYGVPLGTLSTEVFPTSMRATTQGWVAASGVLGAVVGLVLFGALSDATGSFRIAATAVAAVAAVTAVGYRWFPETVGMELEQSAPEIEDDEPVADG